MGMELLSALPFAAFKINHPTRHLYAHVCLRYSFLSGNPSENRLPMSSNCIVIEKGV